MASGGDDGYGPDVLEELETMLTALASLVDEQSKRIVELERRVAVLEGEPKIRVVTKKAGAKKSPQKVSKSRLPKATALVASTPLSGKKDRKRDKPKPSGRPMPSSERDGKTDPK